ncbi:hypothetical protein POM88_034073 [Heracleum sosnowskyi]|uniref:FBD domain-containing protein n=1 Tax=Heracleum sosnowskyi TaxID=360622 RepID=A0AAD8MBW7_9APIA|nr:hypothetical protein POM88_034073 [Heracleum sosnowskyi]
MILDNLFAPFALKISSLKTLSIRQKIINFFFVGSPHINNLILCRQAEVPVTRQESRNMKDRIIGSLGNVRTLQLAGWAFECFTAYRLNHQLSKLEKILLLDFNVCLKNMEGLTNLIGHADGVKKLHISLPPTVAFRNSAVHIINIQGFTGKLYEMSHIKFMMAHFPRLRHLEVTLIREMDEAQSGAYADLISDFPMLSASVEIVMGSEEHFICKNIEA